MEELISKFKDNPIVIITDKDPNVDIVIADFFEEDMIGYDDPNCDGCVIIIPRNIQND